MFREEFEGVLNSYVHDVEEDEDWIKKLKNWETGMLKLMKLVDLTLHKY